jgi:membrane fusion protein, multidrug efflux system
MVRWLLRLLLIPPLALGAFALAWLVMSREPPPRHPPEERAAAVRVIEVPELAVVPRAVGYGVVEPSRVWEGIAEIGARVVEEHPDLARGALLAADTVLLRLDTTDVELRVAEAEAGKAVLEAQLDELERREANTRASLEVEQRALELAEAELARQRELLARGTVAQALVDREERQTVSQRQAVQNLENQLALHPAERVVLAAQLRQREADLATARLDLARAEVRLPFDARIAQVNVRRDQVASRGQVLVVADGMDRAEINAQIPMDRLRRLVPQGMQAIAITPEAIAERLASLGLDAVVRLRAGDMSVEWPGRVARMSEIVDPNTRTVGVIVEVDRPYDRVVPGQVPPLVKSMFVEVELHGRATAPLAVIPRAALRADRVYVVGEDQRLEVRPVEVAFLQGDVAVIASGLAAGEQVVVSDLIPAIEGMRLTPRHDDELLAKVRSEATEREPGS